MAIKLAISPFMVRHRLSAKKNIVANPKLYKAQL